MFYKTVKVYTHWLEQDIYIYLKIVKCATFLLSCQYSQAIQACNCNVMWFKSVRWHDDGSSGHTLG